MTTKDTKPSSLYSEELFNGILSSLPDPEILQRRTQPVLRGWQEGWSLQGSQANTAFGKKKSFGVKAFEKWIREVLRSLCLSVTKHSNPFFSLQTCLDRPKLLHWVMNIELVMPGDGPFQPSPPFGPNVPFHFQKAEIFQSYKSPLFLHRLAAPALTGGYLSEVIHIGLGEVSPMHTSWQVVRHGSSGPRAGRRPQGALKALAGKQWSCVFVCISRAVYDSLCFMTDCCPDTDPVLSPVSLSSTASIQQLDTLPENKLFLLKGEKKIKTHYWKQAQRGSFRKDQWIGKILSKQILLESRQLWLKSLAFLLFICTYNLDPISVYFTF